MTKMGTVSRKEICMRSWEFALGLFHRQVAVHLCSTRYNVNAMRASFGYNARHKAVIGPCLDNVRALLGIEGLGVDARDALLRNTPSGMLPSAASKTWPNFSTLRGGRTLACGIVWTRQLLLSPKWHVIDVSLTCCAELMPLMSVSDGRLFLRKQASS